MQVTLLDVMGDDAAVVDAARVSMDKGAENFTAEQNERLIQYLAKHDHWSPFTHCYVKFRIKAPLFVARQLWKSHIGLASQDESIGWNEVSRRYVDAPPDFYIPSEWRKRAGNVKQGSSDEVMSDDEINIEDIKQFYADITEAYIGLVHSGLCPEQARMFLPQSMFVEWIWTGSLHAWARIYNQRIDNHAQRETQQIAKLIGEAIEPLFPVSWKVLTND
jgi:thymidylate synthase (FAD)